MTDGKKKGTDPFETAPRDDNPDFIAERAPYLPLAWTELGNAVKPQPFRGNAKRNQGNVDAGLAGLIVLALVAGLLRTGGL